jgi:hypothetical protein
MTRMPLTRLRLAAMAACCTEGAAMTESDREGSGWLAACATALELAGESVREARYDWVAAHLTDAENALWNFRDHHLRGLVVPVLHEVAALFYGITREGGRWVMTDRLVAIAPLLAGVQEHLTLGIGVLVTKLDEALR